MKTKNYMLRILFLLINNLRPLYFFMGKNKLEKPSILRDCSPEAEKVHIELLRKAGTAKRFSIMASLTDSMRSLSKRAIDRANPNLSEYERKILFVSLCYGEQMGEKLRKYVQERSISL